MSSRVKLIFTLFLAISLSNVLTAQQYALPSFNKIVTGPHIALILENGPQEFVSFNCDEIPEDKINYTVKNGTLHIYLDHAKNLEKRNKVNTKYGKKRVSIYAGRKVTATVSYRHLSKLVIKGEEDILVRGMLENDRIKLTAYGDSYILINEIEASKFKAKMYGDCLLKIEDGSARQQKYVLFGDHIVEVNAVSSEKIKTTNFGASELNINTDELKYTSYGEIDIELSRGALIRKGIVLGESSLSMLE